MKPNDTQANISKNRKRKDKRCLLKTKLEDNAITNLSNYTLTQTETDLLNKGLSFRPQYNTNRKDLQIGFHKLIKRLHTDFHFRDDTFKPRKLHRPTDWSPPTPLNPTLTTITQQLHNTYTHTLNTLDQLNSQSTTHPSQYSEAITSLKRNKDIIIKRADKGGSVVLMNTKNYIDTAHTHLNQPDVYEQLPTENTHSQAQQPTTPHYKWVPLTNR